LAVPEKRWPERPKKGGTAEGLNLSPLGERFFVAISVR
jgi:hypothetical protein